MATAFSNPVSWAGQLGLPPASAEGVPNGGAFLAQDPTVPAMSFSSVPSSVNSQEIPTVSGEVPLPVPSSMDAQNTSEASSPTGTSMGSSTDVSGNTSMNTSSEASSTETSEKVPPRAKQASPRHLKDGELNPNNLIITKAETKTIEVDNGSKISYTDGTIQYRYPVRHMDANGIITESSTSDVLRFEPGPRVMDDTVINESGDFGAIHAPRGLVVWKDKKSGSYRMAIPIEIRDGHASSENFLRYFAQDFQKAFINIISDKTKKYGVTINHPNLTNVWDEDAPDGAVRALYSFEEVDEVTRIPNTSSRKWVWLPISYMTDEKGKVIPSRSTVFRFPGGEEIDLQENLDSLRRSKMDIIPMIVFQGTRTISKGAGAFSTKLRFMVSSVTIVNIEPNGQNSSQGDTNSALLRLGGDNLDLGVKKNLELVRSLHSGTSSEQEVIVNCYRKKGSEESAKKEETTSAQTASAMSHAMASMSRSAPAGGYPPMMEQGYPPNQYPQGGYPVAGQNMYMNQGAPGFHQPNYGAPPNFAMNQAAPNGHL